MTCFVVLNTPPSAGKRLRVRVWLYTRVLGRAIPRVCAWQTPALGHLEGQVDGVDRNIVPGADDLLVTTYRSVRIEMGKGLSAPPVEGITVVVAVIERGNWATRLQVAHEPIRLAFEPDAEI